MIYIVLNFIIYAVILLLILSSLHEFLHAATYIIFGGKVHIGFKMLFAYTMEVSELPLERKKFLIVLMAPLIVISILSTFFPELLGKTIYLLNILGSTGDITMTLYLCKLQSKCMIVDSVSGFEIIFEKKHKLAHNFFIYNIIEPHEDTLRLHNCILIRISFNYS